MGVLRCSMNWWLSWRRLVSVQHTYSSLSSQGHPGGDPNDSTSSAVALGHGATTQTVSPMPPLCLPPDRGIFPQEVHKVWAAMLCWPLAGCSVHKATPEVLRMTPRAVPHRKGMEDHSTGPRTAPLVSHCIASMVSPTGDLTPQCEYPGPSLAPTAVVDAACLTPGPNDGEVASCLEESLVPLAQRPRGQLLWTVVLAAQALWQQ